MKFITLILVGLFSFQTNAFDVICTCEDPCKQVVYSIDANESGPTFMTVETEKSTLSGYAVVSEDKVEDRVVYRLGSRVLVQDQNQFNTVNDDRVCSVLVEEK